LTKLGDRRGRPAPRDPPDGERKPGMTEQKTMRAMVLEKPRTPLREKRVPVPVPSGEQVLLEVQACGVCRTDLHIADGELKEPKLPLIPGHQIVGIVVGQGANVSRFKRGDRLGVPWLGYTDGTCRFCRRGQENLCDHARFTGYSMDGGYAEYAVADQRFCFPLPFDYDHAEVAPLLCAGLIGYRAYRLAGDDVRRIGFYGFGAAAHLLAQLATYQEKEIYAFTRPGDAQSQEFARSLGAVWAGSSTELPPEKLDAAIIFAPVGALYPAALRALVKGGTVVSAGIHMSDIPAFPYEILWEERVMRSVANLTRRDGTEFLDLVPKAGIRAKIELFPLERANEALDGIRSGSLEGAAVLQIASPK
jgi:propanol-preferring alcohol dehydrogenase